MVLEIPEIAVRFGKPVLIFIVAVVIYFIIMAFIKRKLLSKVRTKSMRHNVMVFSNLITYLFKRNWRNNKYRRNFWESCYDS